MLELHFCRLSECIGSRVVKIGLYVAEKDRVAKN